MQRPEGEQPDTATQASLATYAHLIETATLNLMSNREVARVQTHVADSLAVAEVLPTGPLRCVDVGSGAGFPAIPLALVRPDTTWVLLESVRRKADFLRATIERLGLTERVTVCAERSEDAARGELRDAADVATGRALASPAASLELLAPLLRTGGMLCYQSTRAHAYEADIRSVADAVGLGTPAIEPLPTELRADGAVILATKERSTPPEFPRRAGLARARPLA